MTRCPDCNSLVIGIEYAYPHPDRYDGVSEWRCSDESCGARFGRWSGKRLADGETEPRWGERRERCNYADKYQAKQPPTCGCVACMKKWKERNDE